MAKVDVENGTVPPTYSESAKAGSSYQYQQQQPGFAPYVYATTAGTSSTYYASNTTAHHVEAVPVTISEPVPSNYHVPDGVHHAETYMAFSERSIKMAFIRKVYAILVLQLLVTFGIICVFVFVQPIKDFCINNWWMMMVSFGIMIVAMVLMCCVMGAGRKYPLNIILLAIYTLCESFAVATLAAYFDVFEVLIAFGITMLIAVSITLFTMQKKWDFTFCYVAAFILVMFLITFGMFSGLYYGLGWNIRCYPAYTDSAGIYHEAYCYYTSVWYILSCGAFALLFSIYLAMDTTMIVGGKHKFEISPEDYIFAALNLYIDIITIFLYLLMAIGRGGSN